MPSDNGYLNSFLRFANYFRGGRNDGDQRSGYAKSYGPFKPTFMPTLRRPANNNEAQKLYNHVRTVAWYMDALPFLSEAGLPFKMGVDDIVSMVPLYGDLVGFILSLYQIFLSWVFGVPLALLGWMLLNVVIDAVIGFIPVLGDIADILFKANLRNLDLLEGWLLDDPNASRYRISLMPKNEFLPRASRSTRSRRSAEANGRDKYRNPTKTERMQKGQYTTEPLD